MLKKRQLALIAGAAALLIAAAVFISICAINSKTIKVAFYGVDEKVQEAVKEEISKMNLRRVKYFDLDAREALPVKIQKNYSILIAKNSLAVKNRAKNFLPIDERIFESLPSAIRKAGFVGEKPCLLPLLLDHFEISYYEPLQKELKIDAPQSYGGLLRYLEASKKKTEIPLACAGGNDSELLAFVSAMAQTLYGAEDYKKMLDILRESSALNKNNLPDALTRVLEEIKALQKNGLLYPQWTKATLRDLRFFMQERKTAVVAMHLSERRAFEFHLIKYFDSNCFPQYNPRAERGIIAPQIVAALLSKKKDAVLILAHLVRSDAQTELSNISLLAPTASRAESVDRQADDIRFWAASSAAGALGGIEEECEVSSERLALLAKKIRIYLEN